MLCTNPTGQTNCPVIPAATTSGSGALRRERNAKDPVTKVAFNSTCASETRPATAGNER